MQYISFNDRMKTTGHLKFCKTAKFISDFVSRPQKGTIFLI